MAQSTVLADERSFELRKSYVACYIAQFETVVRSEASLLPDLPGLTARSPAAMPSKCWCYHPCILHLRISTCATCDSVQGSALLAATQVWRKTRIRPDSFQLAIPEGQYATRATFPLPLVVPRVLKHPSLNPRFAEDPRRPYLCGAGAALVGGAVLGTLRQSFRHLPELHPLVRVDGIRRLW